MIKNKLFSFSFPNALKKKVQKQADEENRSLAGMIVHALTVYLKNTKNGK